MTNGARSRLLKLAPAIGTVMLIAAGCAKRDTAPQTSLDPAGPAAQKIHNLIGPTFILCIVIGVAVIAAALFVAWKFGAKDDDDYNEFPAQVHGHFAAEIGWTIAPMILLAVIGILTVALIFDLAKKPSEDAVHVEVFGAQWWWEYRYDLDGDGNYDDIVTANDLVIPAGREIALRIRSYDVIHSWWAPSLNGKQDAVPGRVHPLTIEADEPGEYIGQCTEFCGLSHAQMHIKVVALAQDDYDAWVENQTAPFEPPTEQAAMDGFSAFAGQCTTCHEITGMTDPEDDSKPFEFPEDKNQVAGTAPNLAKFMTRTTFAGAMFDLRLPTPECKALGQDWAQTDEGIEKCLNRSDLRAWLRDSPSMKEMAPGEVMNPESRGMPNFNLSEDQINDLVAFLTTLK